MANVAEAAPSNLQELTLSPRSDTDSSASESPVLDAGMESSVSIAGSLDSPLDEKASRPSFLRVDSLFRGKVSKCSLDASEKARILGTLGFVDIASKAINCGMEYGAVPSLAADDSSTGGSYFVRGADQSPIGVFKPVDEEPFAKNNPKGNISVVSSGPGIKSGINIGEGAVREVAAYVLDHGSFVGVPPTSMAVSRHGAYCYNAELRELGMSKDQPGKDIAAAATNEGTVKSKQLLLKLPPKVGSVQMFVPHTADAENLGNSYWDAEEVQRIAMLDIRLCNTDRNAANMLVRSFKSMNAKSVAESRIPEEDGSSAPLEESWEPCVNAWNARMQQLARRGIQKCCEYSDAEDVTDGSEEENCIAEAANESDGDESSDGEDSATDAEAAGLLGPAMVSALPAAHGEVMEEEDGCVELGEEESGFALPAQRQRSSSCFMPSPAFSVASQPLPERAFDSSNVPYFPHKAGGSQDISQFMSPDFGPSAPPAAMLDTENHLLLGSDPKQSSVWRSGSIKITSFASRPFQMGPEREDGGEEGVGFPEPLAEEAHAGQHRGLHTPPPKERLPVGIFLSKFTPVSPVPAPNSPATQGTWREGAASTGLARSISDSNSMSARPGSKSPTNDADSSILQLVGGNEAWADIEDDDEAYSGAPWQAETVHLDSRGPPRRPELKKANSNGSKDSAPMLGRPPRSPAVPKEAYFSSQWQSSGVASPAKPMTVLDAAASMASSVSAAVSGLANSPPQHAATFANPPPPIHMPPMALAEGQESPRLQSPSAAYVSPTSPKSTPSSEQSEGRDTPSASPPRRVSGKGKVLLAALGLSNDSVTPVSLPFTADKPMTPERPQPIHQRLRSRSVSNSQGPIDSSPLPKRGAGPTLLATLRSMGVENTLSPKDRDMALIANVAVSAAIRNNRHRRRASRSAKGKPPLRRPPSGESPGSEETSSTGSPDMGPAMVYDAATAGVQCSSLFAAQAAKMDPSTLLLQCRSEGFGLRSRDVIPALKDCNAHELVPIDHGLILPHIGALDDVFFAWRTWKQVKQPIVPSVRAYIEKLDGRADAMVLWELFGDAIRPGSLLTLRVCTCLLQEGAKAGLTFHEMALLMERTYEPSALETAVRDTRAALKPEDDEAATTTETPSGRFFADHDRFMEVFPRFMRAHIRRQLSKSKQ